MRLNHVHPSAMTRKFFRAGGASLRAALIACAAVAATDGAAAEPQQKVIYQDKVFDLSVSAGAMSMAAKEVVYAPRGNGYGIPGGAIESRLDWKTRAAGVTEFKLGVNLPLATRVETGLLLPFTFRNSKMADTDWLSGGVYPQWTDRSQHSDVRIGRSFTLDLKLLHRLYEWDGASADLIAGFRHVEQKWTAYGGRFVYTEPSQGDCSGYGSSPPVYLGDGAPRNCIGSFDPVAQISFRQQFETPYLGFRAAWRSGPWRVSADVVGSPFVISNDRDLHVDATLFNDRFRQQKMLGATGRVGYDLGQNTLAFVEADSQTYFLRKGTGFAHPLSPDGDSGPYSSGLAYKTLRLSAGLKVALD